MDEPSPERNEKGHFLPGCKPGPGNPHSKHVNRWRARFFELLKEEDFDGCYAAMLKGCREGDAKMLAMFFQYAMGKPIEVAEDEGDSKDFTIRVIRGETKKPGGETDPPPAAVA